LKPIVLHQAQKLAEVHGASIAIENDRLHATGAPDILCVRGGFGGEDVDGVLTEDGTYEQRKRAIGLDEESARAFERT
jgi:hypothetical protein